MATDTFQRNAKGVKEILNMKFDTFPFEGDWYQAFGYPEKVGVWFIWGTTGNGKTSFVMQLCKELCKYGKVVYNSLEEGACKTMQDTLKRFNMIECGRRFLVTNESMDELGKRLSRKKSPDFVVIDSFQYTRMSYPQYIEFKEANRNKLIIFISHANGQKPLGRPAVSAAYDASLKIFVHGYRAFTKGRFMGPRKYFDIWPEEAIDHWEPETSIINQNLSHEKEV